MRTVVRPSVFVTVAGVSTLLAPETVVTAGPLWTVAVNRNRNLLGKTMLVANRSIESVNALTLYEWSDLFRQITRITAALDELFSRDQYNHAFLMNADTHVHLHVIPRYAPSADGEGRSSLTRTSARSSAPSSVCSTRPWWLRSRPQSGRICQMSRNQASLSALSAALKMSGWACRAARWRARHYLLNLYARVGHRARICPCIAARQTVLRQLLSSARSAIPCRCRDRSSLTSNSVAGRSRGRAFAPRLSGPWRTQ